MVDKTPRDRHGKVLEYIRKPYLDELRDAKSRTYCSGCTRRLPANGDGVWWSKRRLWCPECFHAGKPDEIDAELPINTGVGSDSSAADGRVS